MALETRSNQIAATSCQVPELPCARAVPTIGLPMRFILAVYPERLRGDVGRLSKERGHFTPRCSMSRDQRQAA